MRLSIAAFQPRDLVGQWLKLNSRCDTVHHVIWKQRGGNELRTGCQMTMDARQVVRPALGARLCETCQANLRSKTYHAKTRRH